MRAPKSPSVENGLEAIKALSQRDYAMIFMDMQMPVLDGYTATRRIREVGLKTPIVALTGNAMKGDRDKCIDAGCDDFLSKPVDLDALIACSVRYLGRDQHAEQPAAGKAAADDAAMDSPGASLPEKQPAGDRIHSSLSMDDVEFREIVGDFIDRLDTRIEMIQQACQDGDHATVRSEAHWLKGSGGTVGFAEFNEPAAALEEAAKAGDNDQAAKILSTIIDIRRRLVHPLQQSESVSPVSPDPSVEQPPSAEPPLAANRDQENDDPSDPIYCDLPLEDPDFLVIVVDFLSRLDRRLHNMSELLSRGDFDELLDEAHWLKGAGGTVGFGEFTDPTVGLMEAVKNKDRDAAARRLTEIISVRRRIVLPKSAALSD